MNGLAMSSLAVKHGRASGFGCDRATAVDAKASTKALFQKRSAIAGLSEIKNPSALLRRVL